MVSISSLERSTPVFLRWVAATGIGTGLGMAAGILATFALQNIHWINQDRFFAFAMLLGIGVFLGLAQGRVVTAALGKPVAWFPATIVGHLLAAGAFLVPILYLPLSILWDDALLLAGMGAVIGGAQWWVIRGYLPAPGLWIIASAVGFLSYLWLIVHPTTFYFELILVGAILGAIGAVVTGLLMTRLQP